LLAAIARRGPAVEQALRQQSLDQAGDIPVRDHHPRRQFAERHAAGILVELGHQIEAGQGDMKRVTQTATDLALDHVGAGQQPQPQAQFCLMIARAFCDLGFGVQRNRNGVFHHVKFLPRQSATPRR
jgi:hypothetical protein